MRPHALQLALLALVAGACTDATAPTTVRAPLPATDLVAASGPGGVTSGMRVWLRAGEGISATDGGLVTFWADQSGNGNNASFDGAAFGELPPVYDASNAGVNGRPTVRFNAQNALELDLSWLAGSDYTIIVANGRDRIGLANFYIAGDLVGINGNLTLGYERTDLLRQAHFGNDLDAVVENYTGTEIWSLDTHRFAQSEGRDLFHNGSLVATDDNAIALLSNTGTTLGHFRAIPIYWFQGDLAEVIVYDRALSPDERLYVESELAGRYGYSLDVEDYVPCNASWGSHGAYVAAHAHAVNAMVATGAMSHAAAGLAKAAAAQSTCGA